MKYLRNSRGFAAFEIILVLIVISLVGLVGWNAWQKKNAVAPSRDTSFSSKATADESSVLAKLKADFSAAGLKESSSPKVTDYIPLDKDYGMYFVQESTFDFAGYTGPGFQQDVAKIEAVMAKNNLSLVKGKITAVSAVASGWAIYKDQSVTCEVDPRGAISHIDCNRNSTLSAIYSDVEAARQVLSSRGIEANQVNQVSYLLSSDKAVRGVVWRYPSHYLVKIGSGDWQYVAGATTSKTKEEDNSPACSTLQKAEYKGVLETLSLGGWCEK